MNVVFQKDKKENKKSPLSEIGKTFFDKIKDFKIPDSFYYFIILVAIGFGFYMMMLVQNDMSLAYGGDYSAQYIPMGYHIWNYYHEWFSTGHFILFDETLFLGANSFGSNAYYGLFSPFNIIIVLFPRTLVPQAVAIASIIKLACAGLFFSFYMVRAFKVKAKVGRLCGIAYAFAGWGAFYLWYNNYQDILVFLPLVLLGIECTIQEEKPWILCLGVFFIAICNYVLMVPYIICAFFYAMFRFFQQIRTKTIKDNLRILGFGVIGFAGGLLMSLFIFMPAFMATMSSPKLDVQSYGQTLKDYLAARDFKNFFKLLFSWKEAADQHGYIIPMRVYYPILEFFFPATTCRSLPTLEIKGWDFDDIAVSLWCYIPFIMFLVPALIQSGRERKWSHYIGFALLTLTLFTPFMYYLTMGFSNGYARWTLFIASSLIAYVGIYIDKIPNVSRWHMHVGFVFAIAGIITAWILTIKLTGQAVYVKDGEGLKAVDREFIHRFAKGNNDFTNTAFIVELCYTLVVYLVLLFTYNKKAFHVLISLFTAAEAIAMGNFVTNGHGYDSTHNNGYPENERFRTVLKQVQNGDDSFYRIYTSIGDAYSANNSFMNNYCSASFFHSLYNFEIDDFSLWTGLRNGSKSVSGNYRGKYQDLDNLLGVKYYFISKQKSKYDLIEQYNPNGYMANVPFDFERNAKYDKYTNEYLVYENQSLNKFGYSYSTLYNGSLKSANEGVRFEVGSIKNAITLSSTPVVSQKDSEEIKANYSDISIIEEVNAITTLKTLYLSRDYYHYFYDLSSIAKYYPFNEIPNIPDKYPTTSFVINESEYKWATNYFVFYTATVANQPLFKAGTALYVRAPFSPSQKYDFYFIDKDNKIFMYDSHDDDTTDNTCYMRGFYIKRDVYRLAICGKYASSYLYDSSLNMYIESREDYEVRKANMTASPIENVTYTQDKFTFETHNQEANRFVVSRVAYDSGWKIKAKDSNGKSINIKVYKGNGGFVSFVAPKGDYSYEMVYETPYLTLSYIVSALSFTGFFTSMVGYHIYQEKKKRHHLDQIFRENY